LDDQQVSELFSEFIELFGRVWGKRPLAIAVEIGRPDLLKVLLAAGADPNLRTSDNWTMLMFAAFDGNVPIMRALVESGVSIDGRGSDGTTALHWAANRGNLQAVKFLIEAGANRALLTDDEATASEYALAGNHREIAELLSADSEHLPGLLAALERCGDNKLMDTSDGSDERESTTLVIFSNVSTSCTNSSKDARCPARHDFSTKTVTFIGNSAFTRTHRANIEYWDKNICKRLTGAEVCLRNTNCPMLYSYPLSISFCPLCFSYLTLWR
jgi:hypothetical protein